MRRTCPSGSPDQTTDVILTKVRTQGNCAASIVALNPDFRQDDGGSVTPRIVGAGIARLWTNKGPAPIGEAGPRPRYATRGNWETGWAYTGGTSAKPSSVGSGAACPPSVPAVARPLSRRAPARCRAYRRQYPGLSDLSIALPARPPPAAPRTAPSVRSPRPAMVCPSRPPASAPMIVPPVLSQPRRLRAL